MSGAAYPVKGMGDLETRETLERDKNGLKIGGCLDRDLS